jgi:hypothetical protein
MKQAATSEQSSRPRLDAARAQMEQMERSNKATELLSKLEAWRSEHFALLGTLRMAASRLEEGARNYVQLDRTQCLARDVTAVANELIAGKDLDAVITAARGPLEKTLYSMVKLAEPEDLNTIRKIDFERGAVMALDRAIELQKKHIASARAHEISELSHSLAGERAVFARQLLSVLKNLNELANHDRGLLVQKFGSAELDFHFLKPGPFPTRVLGSEARTWFLDCVEEKLLEETEIRDLV